MKESRDLREKIRGIRDDEQLLLMVHVYKDQYREEALDYARTEIKRRGLSLTPLISRKTHDVNTGLQLSDTTRKPSNANFTEVVLHLLNALGASCKQVVNALFNQHIVETKVIPWEVLGLILSLIFFGLSVLGSIVLALALGVRFPFLILLSLPGVRFFYVRYAALRRRKQCVEAFEVLDARKDESPVLYLRSFRDDDQTARVVGKTTEAEQLAMVFEQIGPFIEVWDSNEPLPHLGPASLYLGNDSWHERVLALMQRAQLVVIRIGLSQGLLWEVQAAFKRIAPERLILLVPCDKRLYEAFQEKIKELSDKSLPEYRERVFTRRSMDLQGLVYFEPNGTPHFVSFGTARGSSNAPDVPMVVQALQPAFQQLGIHFRVPTGLTRFFRSVSPFL